MFKSFVRTVGLTCLAGVIGLATEAQGAATLSLKAVKKNGVAIAATNSVAVVANDTITADLFLSGWGTPPFDGTTGLVKTYQATVLGALGAISNGVQPTDIPRMVLPVGWVAPYIRESCSAGCPNPNYPNCHALYGCIGPGHNPDLGASIGNTRSDFIFFGFSTVLSTEVSTLDYKWAGTINGTDGQTASRCQAGGNIGGSCSTNADCPGSTCNASFLSYLGTYNLKVGTLPCGDYTFNFSSDVTFTFISNTDPFPTPVVPTLQGLTITTGVSCPPQPSGACCNTTNPDAPTCSVVPAPQCTGVNKRYGGDNSTCANIQPACAPPCNPIIAVSPEHCTIDARVPFAPNTPNPRLGFNQMILTFQNPPGAGEDAPNDFTVAQVPVTTPPVPPTILSVVNGPGANQKTLTFSAAIQSNRWTCVRHNLCNKRRCLGSLPGDANVNLAANPTDILHIIDNLNHVIPALPLNQCDIDRAGTCAAADILAEIDLLNGANGYPNQNGRTLEACPSIDLP